MNVTGVLLAILIIIFAYIYHGMRRHFSYWKNLNIPADAPHWLLGSLSQVPKFKTFTQLSQEYYDKYKNTGPFAGFFWFFRQAVFVMDPELIKNILIKDFTKFMDRGMYCNEEDDPLTGQLFNLESQKWRNMRNKLSPTFTSGKMKVMFPLVLKEGRELMGVLEQSMATSNVVEVKDLVSRFTTDVIGTCAFGIDINSLTRPDTEFRKMGRKAFVEQRYGTLGIAFRFGFPDLARRLHMKMTTEDVEKYFVKIVKDTVDYREQNNVKRNDFMDMLIDLKNNKLMKTESGEELTNLTFNEIAAQAVVFLLAGFETSSTTMSFALYELAQNVAEQQKAREEIVRVLRKHDQQFTYECMREMVYLDQIMQETLRLYTVLPLLNRQALEDYPVPGHPGYVIKKGMPVLIPAGAIHRDERYYPEPNKFNPDNYTPQKVAERDSVFYLPFGDGPRNCIGMRFGKMQVIVGLAMLLQNFKFSVCEQTEIPITLDKRSFVTSSEKGIFLKVEKV